MLPSPQSTRAIIQRYTRLVARFRGSLGRRSLVLPSGAHFPDIFEGDERSVTLLTLRMLEHAGMDDIPVEVRVLDPVSDRRSEASCSSGSCGVVQPIAGGEPRLVDRGDSWLLQVPAAELQHPVVLTTNLARSLALIFLTESKGEGEALDPPLDVTVDLAAVGLGLGGVLLGGSYIYAKSCGGPQIARCTQLSHGELAVVVALFAAEQKADLAPLMRLLPATQAEALAHARALWRGNKSLLNKIAFDPAEVEAGRFELATPRGAFLDLLLGFFGKADNKPRPEPQGELSELAELEALVLAMPAASSLTSRQSSPARLDSQRSRALAAGDGRVA